MPALLGFLLIPALAAGIKAARGGQKSAEKRAEKLIEKAETRKRIAQKNRKAKRINAEAKAIERRPRRKL
jgi:hypothetical protein